jgi:hypothetical protein
MSVFGTMPTHKSVRAGSAPIVRQLTTSQVGHHQRGGQRMHDQMCIKLQAVTGTAPISC